jgi:nicotinamidase-related amidase
MRLRRDDAVLLIVDVQARLAPAVDGHARVIARCAALLDAAKLLEVPALASEHCPGAIGRLVPALAERLDPEAIFAKTHFSCADEPSGLAALGAPGRSQVVVAGMECHVCVMQTALGLAERGFEVYLAGDACGSRREEDRRAALDRMAGEGPRVTTTEAILFEWMHRADRPEFAPLLAIVKSL